MEKEMASIYPGFAHTRPSLHKNEQSGDIDFHNLFKAVQDLTSTRLITLVGNQRKDGTYEVPILRKHLSTGTQKKLQAKVALYVDTYLVPFLDTCEKSARRNFLVEISCTLTGAVSPGFLSVGAAVAHACFCAWLYVLDDACVSLTEKITALQWLSQDWYGNFMQELLNYFETCLDAGCNSTLTCPQRPSRSQIINTTSMELNSIEMSEIRDVLHGLTLLGSSLYAAVQLIVHAVGKGNISRIRQELVNHLIAKKSEALCAPSDVRGYYEQHSNTGAVKPCLEIALAASLYESGLDSDLLFALEGLGKSCLYSVFPCEDTTSYWGTPFQAAMHYCNYSVISANETSFVKDIGRAEESLLAVKIYHQLRSEGSDTCGLDIHSQADHGLILDKYASSDYAFHATKELVCEIRSHMTLMLKACENLVNAANDTCDIALIASARAAVLVFVQCSLGYFLFNPFSRRYCESFAAVKAALQNDKQQFKTAVNVHSTTEENCF